MASATVDTTFVEMMTWMRVAVEYCVKLKPGERALVVTDTRVNEYMSTGPLVQATLAACQYAGAETHLISFITRSQPNEQLPGVVAAAMQAVDVIFTLPTMSPNHTDAVQQALQGGARVLGLGAARIIGRTSDLKYRLMPTSVEELEAMSGLITRVGEALGNGCNVHFTTRAGTDLHLETGALDVRVGTGVCDQPGQWQILPCGHMGAGITPGTAEGTIVVDGSISPIYGIVDEPVVMTVEEGVITQVKGGAVAAEWLAAAESLDDPTAFNVVELGLGVNPKAHLSGTPHEDERIYGGAHVGIGNNTFFGGKTKSKWHVDANILQATVVVDGQTIVENGEYKI